MKHDKTQDMVKHIAGCCLSVRARLLNRIVTAIFDEALRSHGIRSSQLNILVAISAFGPVTSRHLCRVLHMDTSTFSRAISRMKARTWLISESSGEGKTRRIQVTPRGLEKIEQVYPYWEQAQERAAEVLGDTASEMMIATGNKHLLEGMVG